MRPPCSRRRPLGAGPERRSRRRQAGLTLIEMLVTIAIIATGVVGIAYGFAAVVRSSDVAQQQATLDTAARYVVDYMQSNATRPYLPCTTSYPAPPRRTSDMSAGITWAPSFSVAHPGSSLVRSANNLSEVTPLPCSGATDYGVQEISIKVCDQSRCLTQSVWKGDA